MGWLGFLPGDPVAAPLGMIERGPCASATSIEEKQPWDTLRLSPNGCVSFWPPMFVTVGLSTPTAFRALFTPRSAADAAHGMAVVAEGRFRDRTHRRGQRVACFGLVRGEMLQRRVVADQGAHQRAPSATYTGAAFAVVTHESAAAAREVLHRALPAIGMPPSCCRPETGYLGVKQGLASSGINNPVFNPVWRARSPSRTS